MFTREVKIILGLTAATAVIIAGGIMLLSKSQGRSPVSVVDEKILVRADSPKIATESAKVTLVEFGDYECPACRRMYPVIESILHEYAGRINFVYRQFPLPLHSRADPASRAVYAAEKQGKFWEMHGRLYTDDAWMKSADSNGLFGNFAVELGFDKNRFLADIKSVEVKNKLENDLADADLLGINSTPTFFLGNEMLEDFSPELLRQKIDEKINR